jgi:hypothetical protein
MVSDMVQSRICFSMNRRASGGKRGVAVRRTNNPPSRECPSEADASLIRRTGLAFENYRLHEANRLIISIVGPQ